MLKQLAARIAAFFHTGAFDRDLHQELESHLAMLVEENLRRGLTPEEARREALVTLGRFESTKELHRETRGLPALDTILQDLRYTYRTLRRDASFTAFAIVIVGLGIGASSTIFSVVNALLLRPLPFTVPNQLVWISNTDTAGEGLSGETVPSGYFVDMRDGSHAFSDIAAYSAFYGAGDIKLTGDGEPERLTAVPISDNFFSVLGVTPQLGRTFTPQDCKAGLGVQSVVLLSYNLWKRRFDSDPGIVGKLLTLNDRGVVVAGVLPASFDFATVFAPGSRVDLYFPLPLTEDFNRRGNTVAMVGRLKSGVSIQQARTEMSVLAPQIRRREPDRHFEPALSLLDEHVSGHLRPALFLLACAVAVVMLIVCANLSNLLLARTASRQKEMAVRAALGAGRGRLIRQLLTESVVLSCCGAFVGVLLAEGGTRVLRHLDAFNIPLLESVQLDFGALGFTLLLAILTGLLFGVAPALQVPSIGVHESLKDATRGSSQGKRHTWVRSGLVISEIAFACILLVGAGLLVRSFLRLLDVNLGFQPERAAALRVDPGSHYPTQARRNAYYDEVLHSINALPGIDAAGLTDAVPLGGNRGWQAGAKGRTYSMEKPPPPAFPHIVSNGYIKAAGIPLRAGRDFTEQDTASRQPVIIINETLARTLWPGQNAVGQTVTQVDVDRQVIGVVGDVRHLAVDKASGNEIYLPIRQCEDYSAVDLVVRTTLPPGGLASAVRSALKPIDPTLPTNEFRPLQALVDKAVSPRRFLVVLLAGFSAFALILASLGIYAVISYSVTQRTQEIGIRLALGESARDLQARIILQTLSLAGIGMGIGAAASWMLARTLSGLLFGVTSNDPATFAAMLGILTVVAALAGYVPARRASRIDPMEALRAN